MAGSVPPGADLHRMRAEIPPAHLRPRIGRVGQVLAEQPDRPGLPAQRRGRHMMNRAQVSAPLLEQLRRPQPRRAPRVISEGPYPPLPAADRGAAQAAGSLLAFPARQHRLQHLVLRAQQRHPRNQHRTGRAQPRAPAGHTGPEPGTDSPRARARVIPVIPVIILIRLPLTGRGQRPAIASGWRSSHQTRSPAGKRGYRYRNAASHGPAPAPGLTVGSQTGGRQDAGFPHQTRTRKSSHVNSPPIRPSGTSRNTQALPLSASEAP
jgi:hypothetical protein